ncbi:MAG: phage terminase large subunit, partial [Candidatus Woesebacteria bacterium]|nr:phage terminase large subunit [Candidatus Woesebacteria bacterium]
QNDLGPFQEESDEWGSFSLVFSNLNARVTAASTEQSIRGIRHHQYRPDLIICDDVEDMASVKTRESRDKTHNWLRGEVIPAGDRSTKLVVVGNLLHEDSLIMRLKQDIEEKRLDAEFRSYPLINKDDKIAWPGKYPTEEYIEMEKRKVGNEIAWQREYLLQIVPDENQIIYPEHIKYYDKLPDESPRYTFTAVDPAISQRDSACKTAMVSARVYESGKNLQIYIFPNPVNIRLEFIEIIRKIKELSRTLGNGSRLTKVFVEDVGFQKAVIQTLHNEGYPVEGIRPGDKDKRARLYTVSHLIQGGQVLFPRRGAETLIKQLVGFSVERYDDLVDALTLLLGQIMIEESKPKVGITFLNVGGSGCKRLIWDDDDCDFVIDYSGRK